VAIGDPLVELETDKIDLEVAAPQAGVLARIDLRLVASSESGNSVISSDKESREPSRLRPALARSTKA